METTEKKEEVSGSRYERMCVILYSYRSGHLDFIELLKKLEEIVSSNPPQAVATEPSDKQPSD